MSRRITWGDVIGQVAGVLLAVLAVTGASYIWRLPQANSPQAVLVVYLASIAAMAVGAFVTFRKVVRCCYKQKRRLTPFCSFLQLLIWGLFFAFPCIYNPFSWAWSGSPTSQAIPTLGFIGWACVWIGLAVMIIALGWLGLARSFGQEAKRLEIAGLYRVTRNPQLMGGALLITGYVFLWPSWFALGWWVLFAAMTHMMVLTEEEYLQSVHGEAYRQYCQRVPRYLGSPW